MPRRFDIVVMAASVGGIAALIEILSHLPADFPLPIVIVQHRDPAVVSILDEILARRTGLRVENAKVGERPAAGTVYLAPTDLHLTIEADGSFATMDGGRIRHVRSSANPLFESAAKVFGNRVLAVVLTGYDSDGTDGVQAVRAVGGSVIAQDEATSVSFGMPKSAIATGAVGAVLPLTEIAPALVRMARRVGDGDTIGWAIPSSSAPADEPDRASGTRRAPGSSRA